MAIAIFTPRAPGLALLAVRPRPQGASTILALSLRLTTNLGGAAHAG